MSISAESIQDQIPYYLTQEAKENLVKALDRFPRQIEYYVDRYSDEILQGGGWTSVEIIRFEDGARKYARAILLSNSCDVAPENKRELPAKLTFAPVIKLGRYLDLLKLAGLEPTKIENKIVAIKEQKVTSLFYLPKGGGLEDDCVALLDDLHTVPFRVFDGQTDRKKLFTLGQVGFYLFLLKLSVHFCRFHEQVARQPA